MLNPFQFVPAGIVPRLAAGKPYTLLLSKKGEKYGSANSPQTIQSRHLPHLFRLQDEGIMSFSIPIMEAQSKPAGIGVYNFADKEEVRKHMDADLAVAAGIFTYELLSCRGLAGDSLK